MTHRIPRAVRFVTCVGLLVTTVWGCTDSPNPDAVTDEAARDTLAPVPDRLPLKEIMVALERDLAEVAHGLWIEDPQIIAGSATRIAEHPRVPPEQMARIQTALGDEFPAFAQMDGRVHDSAAELAAAAEASAPVTDLFETFLELQNGCLACHVTFRTRVSEALAGPPS